MAPSIDYGRSYASTASLDSTMRTARPKVAASTVSTTSEPASSSHPYLGDGKAMAIESWTASIPAKRAHGSSEDIDPVVQAYLETKMALFRSAAGNSPQRIAAVSRQE